MEKFPIQAVFLDRDGVINEENGIIRSPDQLKLIPGAAEAIRKLNAASIPAIVITNQPVVARGWCSERALGDIHETLGALLAAEGAKIDAIFYCPHHENADDPAFRMICECRKPRPGLLKRAAAEFGLELSSCIFIGDRTVDLQAGRAAGTAAWLVRTGFGGKDGKCQVLPDSAFDDLGDAVSFLLEKHMEVKACKVEPVRKAVILSAGMGTRLGELTRNLPKVMVPIAGKPMLEHHIEWLRSFGVREFHFNLHYLADVISDHFGDGSAWGVEIRYHREERLLGTAGALHAFRERLDKTFLVQYGDVFSRLDLGALTNFHRAENAAASLVIHPSSHPHDSDIIELGDGARIRHIHHKPGDDRFGILGNAGAYLLEPAALDRLSAPPRDEDFCRDLFPRMLEAGDVLCGYNTEDLLLDVGTPERLTWIEQYLKTA
ncbi:MAG: HAD-IIIA family hydrolase [Verrucomicrobiae bacterium]|nr:HAD-IIIA family hydrolase [Verrucomicrobiae bacterium]